MLLLLTILNNKSGKVLDKPLYYLAIKIIFQTHSYPILKSPISKTIHIVQNKRIKRKNVGKLQQNVLTLSYRLLKTVPFSSILLIHLITYVLMLVWWFSSITSIMLDISAFCYSWFDIKNWGDNYVINFCHGDFMSFNCRHYIGNSRCNKFVGVQLTVNKCLK